MKKTINKKRFIPNIFTLLNMFLGFLAIVLVLKGEIVKASWLVLAAAVFDSIDGKLARLLGIPSKFGVEFDSFADTISFCAVPSVLVYTLWVNGIPPLLGGFISFIPLLFGTIRLARFNLSQESPSPYYLGLTTPLNAVVIVGFILFNYRFYGHAGDPRIALVLVVVLGFLMISPVRFAKFPLFSFKQGFMNTFRLLSLLLGVIVFAIWQGLVLFPIAAFYVFWNIVQWMLNHHRFEDEVQVSPFRRS